MAKKRFTDDLFGLFEEPAPQPEVNQTSTDPSVSARYPDAGSEESVEVNVPVRTKRAKKKLSSKGFTSNLDAFLSDGFEREAGRASVAPSPSSFAPAAAPKMPHRRKTGLDLLIRSTVTDEDRLTDGETAEDTKRVTLIFNKDHLLTLKDVAKARGMYLKDVVQEMVSDYLEK
jgi:hypothetical protein